MRFNSLLLVFGMASSGKRHCYGLHCVLPHALWGSWVVKSDTITVLLSQKYHTMFLYILWLWLHAYMLLACFSYTDKNFLVASGTLERSGIGMCSKNGPDDGRT